MSTLTQCWWMMRSGRGALLVLTIQAFCLIISHVYSWKASGEQYDDRVVEVTWDGASQNWIWHRFRDDKEHGNHQSVVYNILDSIKDGVEADQARILVHALKHEYLTVTCS